VNAQTYKNRCEAQLARMAVQRRGVCDISNCPEVIVPVCAPDGQSFDNACKAQAAGFDTVTEGACNLRACPKLFVPVCGEDDKTYGNACLAERPRANPACRACRRRDGTARVIVAQSAA
jgi:hypothetical protein